jgi:predicted phage terminase large subunit-like protein
VGQQEEHDKVVYACCNSLKFLCVELFGMDVWSEFHDEVSAFLKRPEKKKLLLLPRDHLKSTIVTKAWTIQQALKNHNIRILIANSIWDNSRKFLRSIQKQLGDGTDLAHIFGRFTSQHWNQDECTIRQRTKILDAGTWTTTGIEREQTSQHYDLIVADDLHGRENVMTKDQREKVKLYYKDLLSLLDPGGTIVVIGTRWAVDDLYGDLLERKDGWAHMVKTCFKEDGSPLFPERYTLEQLNTLRAEKGSYEFSGQYLNSPVDIENAPFKLKDFKYFHGNSDVPPVSKFLTIDPAMTQKASSDNTGLMVCGMDKNRNIYVLDYVNKKLLPRDIINEVFRLMERWSLTRCGIESYGYQLALKYSIQEEMRERNRFFTIEEMRKPKEISSKEKFCMRLQPFFEQGMIKIRVGMTELVDELVAFPRGKQDNLTDCLAYQLDYLVPASEGRPSGEAKPNTYRWWVEKKLPIKAGDIYQKFLEDLKQS